MASLRKFSPVVFRSAVAGLWSRQPARRVRASSRRFWGEKAVDEKQCEDASHSQLLNLSRGRTSRTQAGRQCKMPLTHSDRSLAVLSVSRAVGTARQKGKAARLVASERGQRVSFKSVVKSFAPDSPLWVTHGSLIQRSLQSSTILRPESFIVERGILLQLAHAAHGLKRTV